MYSKLLLRPPTEVPSGEETQLHTLLLGRILVADAIQKDIPSRVLYPSAVLRDELCPAAQYYLKCNSLADEERSQCTYNTIIVRTSLR